MWRVFKGVRQLHRSTDVGVFFCGPKPLGHVLHLKCNEWSQPGKDGTTFTFGKVVPHDIGIKRLTL
jgi:hypothetical protein